jgi:HlyD family secretion protein
MPDSSPSVSAVLASEVRGASRRRRITWAIAAAFVILAMAGGWYWWSATQRGAIALYRTEPAALADIVVTVVATGTLGPTGRVDVLSALTGTIVSVEAEINDKVVEGQPLARIDASDLEVRMARATAVLAGRRASELTAEANLADAETALSRTTQLAETQSVSKETLELAASAVRRARAGLAMAAADVKAAEADLQTARMDLEKTCICAPIDGVVLSSNATLGESIAASGLTTPLFTLVEDLSRLNLDADIDEVDIGQVNEGDPASFTVEAWPDRRFAGTIEKLHYAPVTTDGVVSYRAVLSVGNADLQLRPGMTAIADIIVDRAEDVLAVPNAALRFAPDTAAAAGTIFAPVSSVAPDPETGSGTVWVLTNGTPEEIAVTTGLSDGQVTQITGGTLKPGDAVIVGTDAG